MDYLEVFQSRIASSPEITSGTVFLSIIALIGLWKIFIKAGQPGWTAIVPLVNTYFLFKITWGKGWKFLLLLIPIVNIFIYVFTLHRLSKAFGKGVGFTLGLIFFSFIFTCILGFGGAQYEGVPN